MDADIMQQESGDYGPVRPTFHLGQHDSKREFPLNDLQYGHILNTGMSFVTTPVTNNHFHFRVAALASSHLAKLQDLDLDATETASALLADPIIPPLSDQDTGLYPSPTVNTYIAYTSPWIDLCSTQPVISNISRQVLNLEINYANFCGVRSVVIPGPRLDGSKSSGIQGVAQYARAIQEALTIGSRVNIIVHMPMYREPGLEEKVDTLSSLVQQANGFAEKKALSIDLFSTWDSWHTIRTVCSYSTRLYVALRLPKIMPEKHLQERWFSEPLHYLSMTPETFQLNKAGHPCLTRHHQETIFSYMRLKNAPWILLCDIGPDLSNVTREGQLLQLGKETVPTAEDFPTLAEAKEKQNIQSHTPPTGSYIAYLKWLELQQPPLSYLESTTLTNFQDWLQSPLQPLSDNLESATYEIFEGDPVKYNQYEVAMIQALSEWRRLRKSTSLPTGAVVIAVAGSGRGPLVSRALKASEFTGVPVEVWAVEKNPNAYVYLLRQNETVWGGCVNVVKTDMRAWKGPLISGTPEDNPVYGKVDILVSELLGSFADNELSPECLDGIQHVLAQPHGISIPKSYTAHLSPIATPRIHSDLLSREPVDPNAFETPWVVRLFAVDFVAQRVPDHPRFQQAWEFSHPLPESTLNLIEARHAGGVVGGGGGSMAGAAGANDHNSRHCHLTFVCRTKGVIHGLAGYFESTLYETELGDKVKVEISTLPDMIDRKSKDMISWFPIFFPLKKPLYFPADTELEVSMWRQTDDKKVWYEWLVEAYMWIGPEDRIKVGESELCTSRKVACLM